MASVIREIDIDAPPETVWSAVGDFAGGPLKTCPGLIVACLLEAPDLRVMTFADGTVARERLIARDDAARRIVWGWVGEAVAHDNTSMQVFPVGTGGSRLVWIHDTLPDELTNWLAPAMDQVSLVLKRAMESAPEAGGTA